MSKERELLKTILAYMCAEYLVITEFEMITRIEDTVKEIQELLAQPETKQEPVAWRWKKTSGWVYQDNNNNGGEPLYLAPPTRQPLSDEKVREYLIDQYSFEYRDGFVDGVLYAEKAHGIGGGE